MKIGASESRGARAGLSKIGLLGVCLSALLLTVPQQSNAQTICRLGLLALFPVAESRVKYDTVGRTSGHSTERGERWQATRLGLNANCRTFMLVFTVATSRVEMNSTPRLSPPAFIPAQSAAMMARSISSFETWMPPRLAQTTPLPAVQQANAVLRCCADCALTSLRPTARTNSLVSRFLSSARIANLVTSFGCSSVRGRTAISLLEIRHAASRVRNAAPLCAMTSANASSAVV